MNAPRMLALASLIEKMPDVAVDMDTLLEGDGRDAVRFLDKGGAQEALGHPCGTVGCVAGWAAVAAVAAGDGGSLGDNIMDVASTWLQLDSGLSRPLFHPHEEWGWKASPAEVGAVLRRVASDEGLRADVWRPLE